MRGVPGGCPAPGPGWPWGDGGRWPQGSVAAGPVPARRGTAGHCSEKPRCSLRKGSALGPGDGALQISSPLNSKPCGRSPRFPLRSDPGVCHTAQSAAGRGQDMHRISCLLSGLAFILSATSTDSFARVGTIYKVAYRQVYKQVPQPVASCCPGWSRTSSYELSCNTALCQVPCQNGGRCSFPGRCACPPGWMGPSCQTDADECAGRSHGCSQLCINTAGSFHCACRDGFSLAADNKACQPVVPGPEPGTFSQADPSSEVKEEMKDLKNRVEALEQKLQLVLAPFHNLMPSAPEDVGTDPISRLSHSLQQLDRIDSLSEQISFLEERLETCSCRNEL
uniref:EGF like domain multiple 7 n=1 Tax=Gallus gallus TaxID=9031 RepID=A0A8V1AG57_CHICK